MQRSKDERNNDYEHQSTFTSPPFRGARPGDSPTAHHLGKSAYRFADTSRSPRRSLDGRRSVDGSDLTTTSGAFACRNALVRLGRRRAAHSRFRSLTRNQTRALGADGKQPAAFERLTDGHRVAVGGIRGDSTPSSLASAGNPFGMAEDTTEGARGTDAWGTNGADATDEEGRVGAESPSARTSPNPRESHRVYAVAHVEDNQRRGRCRTWRLSHCRRPWAERRSSIDAGDHPVSAAQRSPASDGFDGADGNKGLEGAAVAEPLRDFVVDGGSLGGDAVVAVRGTIASIGSQKTGDPWVGEASLAAPGRSTPDRVCGSFPRVWDVASAST